MFRILAAAFLVMLSASSPALAEGKRVALILGIGEYQHLSSLTNPVRDAKAIATELRDHGFEVSEHYNLDRADLLDALETFKRQAQDAEVALVYYAGHGVEAGGENYIVPVDAASPEAGGVVTDLIPVSSMLAELQRKAPIAIVLLDACRDNPYPLGTLVAGSGGAAVPVSAAGLGASRGAASLRNTGPETLGTVIGYAAEPGRAALDHQLKGAEVVAVFQRDAAGYGKFHEHALGPC